MIDQSLYELDTFGLFLSFIWFVFLCAFNFFVFNKIGIKGKKIFLLNSAFGFYFIFFIANHIFNFLPFFPDTNLFKAMVINGYYPEEQSLGVLRYHGFVKFLNLFFFECYEIFSVFSIYFVILSFSLFYRSFELYFFSKGRELKDSVFLIYVLMICLYPAALAFFTVALREWIIVFGFSLTIYAVMRKLNKNSWLFYFLCGGAVVYFARPTMIIIPIIMIFVFDSNKRKLMYYPLLLILVPVLFDAFTSYKFSPEFFTYLRNASNESHSDSGMVYGRVLWESYLDIVFDLPQLFFQFFLSPLPIIHEFDFSSMKLYILDLIYIFFILFFFLLDFKSYKRYLIFFGIVGVIFATFEFFIGGAVRHRLPIIMLVIPAAAYSLNNFIRKYLNISI